MSGQIGLGKTNFQAKNLYAEAGYGADHPTLEISYNTLDSHKKIAVAIASMWERNTGRKCNCS